MLKTVADETARSTFEMTKSVIQKASQLNLGQTGTRPGEMHRSTSVQSANLDSETDPYILRHRTPSRQSDFWDTDYSGDQTPSRASIVQVPSPPVPGCSRDDPRSTTPLIAGDSPGAQTLAELKREAVLSENKKSSKRSGKTKSRNPSKAVWRSSKVMREELFEGMNWTRILFLAQWILDGIPTNFTASFVRGTFLSKAGVLKRYSDTTQQNATYAETNGSGMMSSCQWRIPSPGLYVTMSEARTVDS